MVKTVFSSVYSNCYSGQMHTKLNWSHKFHYRLPHNKFSQNKSCRFEAEEYEIRKIRTQPLHYTFTWCNSCKGHTIAETGRIHKQTARCKNFIYVYGQSPMDTRNYLRCATVPTAFVHSIMLLAEENLLPLIISIVEYNFVDHIQL